MGPKNQALHRPQKVICEMLRKLAFIKSAMVDLKQSLKITSLSDLSEYLQH